LDKHEGDKLAAYGYRFGAIAQIAEFTLKGVQVPHEDFSSYLDRMKDYSVEKTS
jgi:hypothetical protein